MTQGTLFDDMPPTPSPRLRWMDRHGVSVRASIMDGRVVYIASRRVLGQQLGNRRGNTEDEALASLALHLAIPGWLEDHYLASTGRPCGCPSPSTPPNNGAPTP